MLRKGKSMSQQPQPPIILRGSWRHKPGKTMAATRGEGEAKTRGLALACYDDSI